MLTRQLASIPKDSSQGFLKVLQVERLGSLGNRLRDEDLCTAFRGTALVNNTYKGEWEKVNNNIIAKETSRLHGELGSWGDPQRCPKLKQGDQPCSLHHLVIECWVPLAKGYKLGRHSHFSQGQFLGTDSALNCQQPTLQGNKCFRPEEEIWTAHLSIQNTRLIIS